MSDAISKGGLLDTFRLLGSRLAAAQKESPDRAAADAPRVPQKTGNSVLPEEPRAASPADERSKAAQRAIDNMHRFSAAARENGQTGIGAIMDKWAAKYGAQAAQLAAGVADGKASSAASFEGRGNRHEAGA